MNEERSPASYADVCCRMHRFVTFLERATGLRLMRDPSTAGKASTVFISVLMQLYIYAHTAKCVSSYCYICVLILLYMCPHTAIYVSSYWYICVLILVYMCPHTGIYVSSYCYICVLILLYMCPHTAVYVSSYCYMCVKRGSRGSLAFLFSTSPFIYIYPAWCSRYAGHLSEVV